MSDYEYESECESEDVLEQKMTMEEMELVVEESELTLMEMLFEEHCYAHDKQVACNSRVSRCLELSLILILLRIF